MASVIPQDREENADKVGYKLYGANWERIKINLKSLDEDFARFIVEVPYGSVFPRAGLKIQERELIAITALTCLGLKDQLKSHLLASLKTGISLESLVEAFIHLAMFIGFPQAMEGLKVLKEIREEKGL